MPLHPPTRRPRPWQLLIGLLAPSFCLFLSVFQWEPCSASPFQPGLFHSAVCLSVPPCFLTVTARSFPSRNSIPWSGWPHASVLTQSELQCLGNPVPGFPKGQSECHPRVQGPSIVREHSTVCEGCAVCVLGWSQGCVMSRAASGSLSSRASGFHVYHRLIPPGSNETLSTVGTKCSPA